jgi:energy-coupling factor transporter ATP-binding protein EcfA2
MGAPAPRPVGGLTIADVVEVVPVDTVVRLDGRGGRLAELVLTGDVTASLTAIAQAACGGGGAFFLVGHFGSGKSHLLAALAELIGTANGVRALPAAWGPAISGAVRELPPGLAVAVPLVEYRSGAVLEDVVVARLRAALGSFASDPGKGEGDASAVDRRATWDALAASWTAAGYGTVLIALDELSEFLRAKRGPALVEDLRFLQFLGEWAAGQRVTVVAALQESIEEVANVSQRELSRIRDRYRTLGLSMRHVEDLVRGRLLRLRPGGEALVEQAYQAIRQAFPGWEVPPEHFARCYPVHPATLSLLEGLRFVFSQQRGVVDFLSRQMLGDRSAGIAPWSERGYTELLTPDRIFDHFRPRLRERSETHQFAETVVPYWERAVGEVFDNPGDAELALRAAKLLALLAASPLERERTGRELAHLLLQRVSSIDPQINVTYLEREVLQPLAARGAYIVATPSTPPAYTVKLEANAAEEALTRTKQARAELAAGDRRVVRSLIALGSTSGLPLELLANAGPAVRDVMWQRTRRRLLVVLTRLPELTAEEAQRLVEQARAKQAEGVLIVAEPELGSETGGTATGASADLPASHARSIVAAVASVAVWVPRLLRTDEEEAVLEIEARRRALAQAKAEERASLVELLGRMGGNDTARAGEVLRHAYFGGTLALPPAVRPTTDLPALAGLPFERVLANVADPLLVALHPRHREIASLDEELTTRSLQRLVTEVIPQLPIGLAAADHGRLRPLIEGHLKPLGLARRTVDAWVIPADAARGPVVAEVLRLVGDGAAPAPEVVQALADGPFGLTPGESLLVLNVCARAGLLEIRRGRSQVTGAYDEVRPGDLLGAGELVEPAVREALSSLAGLMNLGDLVPWNTGVQTASWNRAQAWLGVRAVDVGHVREGLADLSLNPRFAGIDCSAFGHDLDTVAGAIAACPTSAEPLEGLRALAGLAGSASTLKPASRRLATAADFFRRTYPQVASGLAYLDQPDLVLPPDAGPLIALRDKAHRLAADLPALVLEDRGGELLDTLSEFRRQYTSVYREAHDRFHRASRTQIAESFRHGPTYRALSALGSIPAISVPHDKIAVDRALSAVAPAPCPLRAESELLWRPRCSCGFTLGDMAPEADLEAVAALARTGVAEHLAELGRQEHRSRLESAVADLHSLGREALAADLRRLLAYAELPEAADDEGIIQVLAGGVGQVVQDVLAGGQLVVRRNLAALRDDLAGRRYPKRRLLELLAAWVDPSGDLAPGSYLEILDEPGGGNGEQPPG